MDLYYSLIRINIFSSFIYLKHLPSPFLCSGEHFEEAEITNFQWAEAIAGLTVALLVCLEWALDRVIEKKMAAKKGQAKKRASDVGSGEGEADGEEPEGGDHDDDQFKEDEHEHVHASVHAIDGDDPLGSFILTVALSNHSIIEGVGIGDADNYDSFRAAFIAIAVHKAFTAFALGNSLVSSGLWADKSKRKYFYASVGLFILLSIIGIAVGWAISTEKSLKAATTAVFIGITEGAFIYVSAIEILPEEARTIKQAELPIFPVVFFFVAGYVLMALLALWA